MGIDNFESITGLDELIQFMDSYCEVFMIPECAPSEEYASIINMGHEELLALNSDEAYANAFRLQSYCLYLRKDLDRLRSQIAWCEDILNRMVGLRWKEFSDYMKYEVKRQAIINDDTFGQKLDKFRQRLQVAYNQSDHKISHVENMSKILESIGKRKSYDNR